MCGFVGVVGAGVNFPSKAQLRNMRDKLIHRGPDDAGEYFENSVAFGFRRLAILDLSPAGHQPMSNEEGSLCIVFNGEIFNHVELREKLVSHGIQFKSKSDTEVLLALYEFYGTEMFQYLNGFFSFAIYDKRKNIVILARDRLGVKPLYFWNDGKNISFASELKALKELSGFPSNVDPSALGMYMRLNFVPGASCIYKGVEKLPPAHYMTFSLVNPSKYEQVKYWDINWDVDVEHHPEEYWLDMIEDILYDSVCIRLRADTSIGTFLSGGIDSGLITAIAAKITGGDVQAYTVSFPGTIDDEREYAESTAKHLNISTHVEEIDGNDMSLLPELSQHFDEPFSDLSLIPTYQICKKMKDMATVILSGDGGDEMFAGYQYHPLVWKMRYFNLLPDQLLTPVMKILSNLFPAESYLSRNALRIGLPRQMRDAFMQRDICEKWQKDLLMPEYYVSPGEIIAALGPKHDLGKGRTSLDRAQAGDLNMLLPDNMLVKVDRMSMKTSVEVRSPFLDYRFAELLPKIPPALRVKNGQGKYLLRKLSERYLPPKVTHGRKKGFNASSTYWLSGGNGELVKKYIIEESKKMDVLDMKNVDKLWENMCKYPRYSQAILRVYVWCLWANANI